MIKNEKEYRKARERLSDEREAINVTRSELRGSGLDEKQIKNVMDPMITFHKQLEDEVHTYEKIMRGDIDAINNFAGIGRSLIAMRIASGKSQADLASSLGIDQANVSRYERNEYYGAKQDLIDKVIKALGYRAITKFEKVA